MVVSVDACCCYRVSIVNGGIRLVKRKLSPVHFDCGHAHWSLTYQLFQVMDFLHCKYVCLFVYFSLSKYVYIHVCVCECVCVCVCVCEYRLPQLRKTFQNDWKPINEILNITYNSAHFSDQSILVVVAVCFTNFKLVLKQWIGIIKSDIFWNLSGMCVGGKAMLLRKIHVENILYESNYIQFVLFWQQHCLPKNYPPLNGLGVSKRVYVLCVRRRCFCTTSAHWMKFCRPKIYSLWGKGEK